MMKRLLAAVALVCALAGSVCAQNTNTFGNIVTSGATCGSANCVYYQLPANAAWVVVSVSGTWSGSLEIFTISAPNANYANLNTVPWTLAGTETANGTWTVATSGDTFVLVIAPSWTSGSARVTETLSPLISPLTDPVFPGGLTGAGLAAPNGGSSSNCWTTDGGFNVGCGGGSSFTLQTNGTGGAASYSGGILNIPQYQGQITLTTTGSGPATLAGSILNIPQYQCPITVTTTGTSGAATLSGCTLNIPQYSGGSSPTLQHNGTALANQSTLNFNDTTPAPPLGAQAVTFQTDSGGDLSAYVPASAPVAPNLLKFGPPTVIPYYDPQPVGLVDVTDNFGSTGTFTQQNGTGTPTFTVSGNVGTITFSASSNANFLETSDTTLLAPQFFDSVKVTSVTAGATYSNVYAGAFKDTNDYVAVYYDAVGHAIHTEYRYSGTNQNTSIKTVTLTTPFCVGASLSSNSLSGWYKELASASNTCSSDPSPWVYAGNVQTASFFDYTTTSNFASAGYKTGFSVAWGGSGSVSVATLQGGRLGGVAMRDLKPVVNNDWTTYQPGSNTIYFNATASDAVGNGVVSNAGGAGGTLGVYTLNLATQQIVETGVICVARSSHTYCNDGAGNIIYHSDGDREVITSTWSSGWNNTTPVQVEYQYITSGSQPDVLTNNLTVLSSMTQLSLPEGTAGKGAYDPALAWDAANSRYLMAYSITTDSTFAASTTTPIMWPALATATTPTGTWTSIGIDSNLQGNWEGTSFAKVNGTLYELAGGPHYPVSAALNACTSSRVYNESFTYQGGLLGATFLDSTPSISAPCSHPTLFDHPDGQHMVVLTFLGGEFTSGNNLSYGQPAIEISTP